MLSFDDKFLFYFLIVLNWDLIMNNNVHMIAKFMRSLYSAVVTPLHVLSFISMEWFDLDVHAFPNIQA